MEPTKETTTIEPSFSRGKKKRLKGSLIGWLFASPWIIGLAIFYAFPLVSSFYFSFTDYSILQPGGFVGFKNYTDLFNDPLFWKAIYNTVYFAVFFCSFKHHFRCSLSYDVEYESKRNGDLSDDILFADTRSTRSVSRALDVAFESGVRFSK